MLTTVGTVAGFAAAAAVVKRALPSRGDEESNELALVAIFDGIDLKNRASAFTGGSVLAWFGGVALDLRETVPEPDAHLTVHALFGGVAIRVPPGWRLVSNLSSFAGGTDVREVAGDRPDAPTLTLDGRALFGGIAVGARTQAGDREESAAT
jgi:hypothetical protein